MTADPTTINLTGTSRKASTKECLYIDEGTFKALLQRKYPMTGLFPHAVMKNKMTLTAASIIDLISHNESQFSNILLIYIMPTYRSRNKIRLYV
jgi:hypothetical protein